VPQKVAAVNVTKVGLAGAAGGHYAGPSAFMEAVLHPTSVIAMQGGKVVIVVIPFVILSVFLAKGHVFFRTSANAFMAGPEVDVKHQTQCPLVLMVTHWHQIYVCVNLAGVGGSATTLCARRGLCHQLNVTMGHVWNLFSVNANRVGSSTNL